MPMGIGEKSKESLEGSVTKAFLENCRYTEKRTEPEQHSSERHGAHPDHKYKLKHSKKGY